MAAMCSESKPRTLRLLVSYMTLANSARECDVELVRYIPASAWANRGTRGRARLLIGRPKHAWAPGCG